MIDLHSHSIFSDGVLIPSELARRAGHAGLKALGITDHGDSSNIDFIVPRIVAVAEELNRVLGLTIVPGIEIKLVDHTSRNNEVVAGFKFQQSIHGFQHSITLVNEDHLIPSGILKEIIRHR